MLFVRGECGPLEELGLRFTDTLSQAIALFSSPLRFPFRVSEK